MKVVIVEEFNSVSDIDRKLRILEVLEKDHIKASGCKEPNKCEELSALFWYKHNLELAKYRTENYQHRYSRKLSEKMFDESLKRKEKVKPI